MYNDRRQQSREAVGLEASVHVPLRQPMTAFISNISPDGAMVEIDRFEFVPAKFKLVVGDFQTTCYVRHRDRHRIGVEFATTYDMAHDAAFYATAADDWSGAAASHSWR
jgi:hypothetical protein